MSAQGVRMWMRTAALALLAFVLCVSLAGSAQAGTSVKPGHKSGHHGKASFKPRKGPAGLAFYKPPKRWPKGHGKLIWSRRIKPATPAAGIKSTRLLLYTSKTAQGKRTAVSGYLSVPKGRAPKGGWPVITWAHGTTGIADVCAPTRSITSGPPESFVTDWVARGYAVVATDYQGLGTPGRHQYLVGKSEGRSVLDVIRAARQLDRSLGRRFIVTGVSQGGQAALFSSSLAGSWTPDLRLRGTISYAPGSHLAEQAALLPLLTSPSPLSAVAALIFSGATVASPDLKPQAILSDPALALFPQVNRICLPQLSLGDSFGGLAPSTLIREGADTTGLTRVLKSMNPAVKIKGPVLLAQGTADTTAIPMYTDALKGELDAKGDEVTYRKYEGVDHGGIVDAAQPEAIAFFKDRLPVKPGRR
jgi:dienelactone hydrolase